MQHKEDRLFFAKVDEENIVRDAIIIPNLPEDQINNFIYNDLGLDGRWIECSLNTKMGIHFIHKKYASSNQNLALRGNYPTIDNSYYDEDLDAFIDLKPQEDWILNTTNFIWEPPVEKPLVDSEMHWNGNEWQIFDKPYDSWVLITYGTISLWQPPIFYPEDSVEKDLAWNEQEKTWVDYNEIRGIWFND